METCYVNENFVKERFIDSNPDAVVKNALIENIDVQLFRSFLTMNIHFNLGGAFQGYVSPALTGNGSNGWTDVGAGDFISNVIRLFGMDEEMKLQSLKGKPCKVYSDNNGIYAIGDFLQDKWFCPEYYYECLKKQRDKYEY